MITINITKAKAIGHDMRRAARAEEFKPFDEAIAKQIPGAADGAEGSHICHSFASCAAGNQS